MQPWRKLEETPVYTGRRRVLRRLFELPGGSAVPFEVKDETEAVAVLALTPAAEVVLVEEFRPGPERVLLELPGGAVDLPESPRAAAERELLEETGYAGRLEHVGTSLDCAYSTMVRHNFVALECRAVAQPRGDEHEHVRVRLVSLEEFRRHLRSGELTDVETGYLALDYLGLLDGGRSRGLRPASSNAAATRAS